MNKIIFATLAGCFVILITLAFIFLPGYVNRKVSAKVSSLGIQASSININFWKRSVTFQNLRWNSPTDSARQHSARAKTVEVNGVNLYDLLVYKSYVINEILLDSAFISYDQSIITNGDSTKERNSLDLTLKNIRIKNASLQLKTDTIINLSTNINTNIADVHFHKDDKGINYGIGAIDIIAENLNINRHSGTHGISVSKVTYESIQQKASFDSVNVIPNYGKIEMGQHFNEQKSRIEMFVPNIKIEGLDLKKLIDSTIIASRINIQSFNISAFKDKRLPFLRKTNMPMPMEIFLSIPVKIKIDTIIVKDCNITIEEIPETASQSILITFKNVNGKFVGLNNRISKSDSINATLYANGLLMGVGKVDAVFEFPLDGTKLYTASGSIKAMHFSELNQALISAAKIQAKSGYLNKLAFDFKYNDDSSRGKILIDYEDLKITGLTKEREIDEVKTILINLFIRNDKSKKLPKTERTGVIDIKRDKKKFIFNFWWKSILDGLKSSVLGEKTDNHKESKK